MPTFCRITMSVATGYRLPPRATRYALPRAWCGLPDGGERTLSATGVLQAAEKGRFFVSLIVHRVLQKSTATREFAV